MSDEQIPVTPLGYIELKPVVQAKHVHQAVRQFITDNLKLDETTFTNLIKERVDIYLENKGVKQAVTSAINTALSPKGGYWPPDKLTAVINKQVEVAIKSLVHETVRATLSDKLKDAVSKVL